MSTSTMVLAICAILMAVLWFLAMMRLRKQENDHILDMAVMRREYGKDLQSLHEKRQEVRELVKEIGGLEMLIKLKDEELNLREGEFEQNWDDMKKFLTEAHGCIDQNAKLLVILTCQDCTSKKCKLRVEEGNIPEECPLKSAHALHELKIVAKGFSLAHMVEKEVAEQTIKDQIKDKEVKAS